jgi:hypothetical protein
VLRINVELLLALKALQVPQLGHVRRKRYDKLAVRVHAQRNNRLFMATHPAHKISCFNIETLDGAVDGGRQVFGLRFEIVGEGRAIRADPVDFHEAVVVQVEHVDVAVYVACQEPVAVLVETDLREIDLLRVEGQLVCECVLDAQKLT